MTPDLQPTLDGRLVTLRPVLPSDWDEMFAVASDPLIWEVHPERRRYEAAIFRRFFESALESRSAFAILGDNGGRIIGSSRYHRHDPELREIEIGWTFLARPYWGGAYNREVKRLMLEHAFGFVDTVVFWVGEENARSRRAMEKIGGILRDGVRTRDHSSGPTPYVVYEIRKAQMKDWAQAT
ncbi:MAG: GNAT family N-acetyltransferase [Caulobacteraceae bacterium]|nr:GNAT family N-acetyltransferase [Caulobacteraceae bacterium]